MLVHEWAKEKVKEVKNMSHEEQKSYKQEIKGLGSMIVQNGLYGTLAFYNVKQSNKPAAGIIINQLSDLVRKFLSIENLNEFPQLDNAKYLHAQELVLEAISWLRRYADILIEEE